VISVTVQTVDHGWRNIAIAFKIPPEWDLSAIADFVNG